MGCTCVVGLQWGDEAKGKIVDVLAESHDFAVRFNGGANAGHTIAFGGKKFKLSLLPSGIFRPHLRCVVGNGVVIYPPKVLEEIAQLRAGGVEVGDNLLLSERAHVIFPYHMLEDRLGEQASKGGAIGTTGRGIGPCYADKAGRACAVRLGELLDPARLRARLEAIVPRKNRVLSALGDGEGFEPVSAGRLADDYAAYGEELRPYVADTTRILLDAVKSGQSILFECAQGGLLDVDHGTYPYVTSSNSSPAGIWSGSGVSSRELTRVVGVLKAYSTRVGNGPLPTELLDATGESIRAAGHEYGTVTGRPRRVGWLDLVAARSTAELSSADEVALMLLDVLGVVSELKICTAYELDGERVEHLPADAAALARCVPVYETLPGWSSDVTAARKLSDLPAAARRYVDRVAEVLGLPVRTVSVGPEREQTIFA